jgi:hypothetical protein
MQKPSLGRIVLAVGGSARSNGADVAPAIITRVWSEHPAGGWTVNLTVLPDFGQPVLASSAVLYEDEQTAREHLPYESSIAAYWPPRV